MDIRKTAGSQMTDTVRDAGEALAGKNSAKANILTEATPLEETGRQKKHKCVAVAAALEREVKLVKERIRNPPTEQP